MARRFNKLRIPNTDQPIFVTKIVQNPDTGFYVGRGVYRNVVIDEDNFTIDNFIVALSNYLKLSAYSEVRIKRMQDYWFREKLYAFDLKRGNVFKEAGSLIEQLVMGSTAETYLRADYKKHVDPENLPDGVRFETLETVKLITYPLLEVLIDGMGNKEYYVSDQLDRNDPLCNPFAISKMGDMRYDLLISRRRIARIAVKLPKID